MENLYSFLDVPPENWTDVIPLAEAYAPWKLPVIHLHTARLMEQKGEYQTALGCRMLLFFPQLNVKRRSR